MINKAIEIATKLIQLNEGCKLEVYTCPAGYKTFGYGTNLEVLSSNAYKMPTVDEAVGVNFAYKCKQIGIDRAIKQINDNEQIQALANIFLNYEIVNCKKALNTQKWFTDDLSCFQQAIIIDLAYNIGVAGVLKFKKMIEAIKQRNYGIASQEMLDSKYHYQMICFGYEDELEKAGVSALIANVGLIIAKNEVFRWYNNLDSDYKQLRSMSNAVSLQFDKLQGKYKGLL